MTVFLWVSSGEEDIIFPADTRTDHSIHGFSCSRNAISQALPSVTAGFFLSDITKFASKNIQGQLVNSFLYCNISFFMYFFKRKNSVFFI